MAHQEGLIPPLIPIAYPIPPHVNDHIGRTQLMPVVRAAAAGVWMGATADEGVGCGGDLRRRYGEMRGDVRRCEEEHDDLRRAVWIRATSGRAQGKEGGMDGTSV